MSVIEPEPIVDAPVVTEPDIKNVYEFKTHFEKYGYAKTQEDYDKEKAELKLIYDMIISILKKYCDLNEKYYSLIALWIIGTYMHKQFPSFPYLFFNAAKGSGKSRLLRLISFLSKDGRMLNSLTEAVLFRTTGMLGIDEFEQLNWKGKENLVELLNSSYKKGTKVCRMKKVKSISGESQEVEEFDVYRPLCMANISGIDNVLGDRCLTLILDKSDVVSVVMRMEIYEFDPKISVVSDKLHKFPFENVDVVSVYKQWDGYIDSFINTSTQTTHNTLTTQNTIFGKIFNSRINGRNLELTLPLLIIADMISDDVFDDTLRTCVSIVEDKKKDDAVESMDNSVLQFVAQEPDMNKFVSIKELFNSFRSFVNADATWLSDKWFGKSLKRLNLIKDKKRTAAGISVILNVELAHKKSGL